MSWAIASLNGYAAQCKAEVERDPHFWLTGAGNHGDDNSTRSASLGERLLNVSSSIAVVYPEIM